MLRLWQPLNLGIVPGSGRRCGSSKVGGEIAVKKKRKEEEEEEKDT